MSWNIIIMLSLSLIGLTFLIACQPADNTSELVLPGVSILDGEYEGPAFGGILNETWKRESSNSVIQVGYYIEAGDTLVTQMVKIERINDMVYLIAHVKGRPPLIFEGVLITDEKAIFENMSYTNPYRIEYTILENEYHRVTTGTENGEESVNQYRLIRK